MSDKETPRTESVAALKLRVAGLEAELAETRERKAELLEQNQLLRRQVSERTTDLLDSDTALSIEAEFRTEVARLDGRVVDLEAQNVVLRKDRDELRQFWQRDGRKLFMAEQQEADMKGLMRRLYDIAAWAASCTPDTLAETFGDTSADLKRAEALLKEE